MNLNVLEELKEGMSLMYKDMNDIIGGYLNDLEELEEYECLCCGDEGLFIIDNPEEHYEEYDWGLEEEIKCNNCEEIVCSKCLNDDSLYQSYSFRKSGVCEDCWTKREKLDEGYNTNCRRILFMEEVKGIDTEDMCEGVDSDWSENDDFYCWDNEWTEEMEEWERE